MYFPLKLTPCCEADRILNAALLENRDIICDLILVISFEKKYVDKIITMNIVMMAGSEVKKASMLPNTVLIMPAPDWAMFIICC